MFIAKEPLELAYLRDETRYEQQEAIAAELRLDGITDAAEGCSPQNTEAPYLDGYFAEMRRRLMDGEHLEIRWGHGSVVVTAADVDFIEF